MKISIDVDVLNAIASDARKANSECQKAYQIINMVTKGTAWLCREKDDINDNLKSLNRQINNLSEDFSTFAITADSVATNFRDYVYSIDKKYLKDMKSMIGIFGFAAGEVTNIATNVGRKTQILMSELSNKVYGKLFNLNTASIVAACTIPGTIVPFAMFNVTQHAINQASGLANSLINTHNNTPNNVTVTTAADIEQINQSASLPDYVKNDPHLLPDKDGNYSAKATCKNGEVRSVSVFNTTGEVSCTYYTLRKLKERGLGFPFNPTRPGGLGGGNQWMDNFDKESNLPNYIEGEKSLDSLIANQKLPLDNIVLSFDPDHVMLIDHLKVNADGKIVVKYSENWPAFYDPKGGNAPQEKTLDVFMDWYKTYGPKTLKGAVVVGKGVGDY